ncbi:MAG: plastocyanin/azurin family copper-binding protein [Dehalococcoidia bacterium]
MPSRTAGTTRLRAMRRFGRATAAAVGLGVVAVGLGSPAPAQAGGGAYCASDVTSGTGTAVEIVSSCYSPTVLHTEVGAEVVWTSRDQVPHTVTGTGDSWGNYETFTDGETMAFTFDEAGVFPYFCALHPMMQGVVVVGDPTPAATEPAAGIEVPSTPPSTAGAAGSTTVAVALGGLLLGAAGATVGPRALRRHAIER